MTLFSAHCPAVSLMMVAFALVVVGLVVSFALELIAKLLGRF